MLAWLVELLLSFHKYEEDLSEPNDNKMLTILSVDLATLPVMVPSFFPLLHYLYLVSLGDQTSTVV